MYTITGQLSEEVYFDHISSAVSLSFTYSDRVTELICFLTKLLISEIYDASESKPTTTWPTYISACRTSAPIC